MMDKEKRAFGERLHVARKRARLNQTELGKRIGVNYTTVSNWENGMYAPNLCLLLLMAKELGVTVGWLAAGEGQNA